MIGSTYVLAMTQCPTPSNPAHSPHSLTHSTLHPPPPSASTQQVLTGESWSEVVVRPLLFGWHDAGPLSGTAIVLFFTSFLIICAIVLINVVVAVLLEKMVDEPDPPDEDEEDMDSSGPVTTAALPKATVEERLATVEAKLDQVLKLLQASAAGGATAKSED